MDSEVRRSGKWDGVEKTTGQSRKHYNTSLERETLKVEINNEKDKLCMFKDR